MPFDAAPYGSVRHRKSQESFLTDGVLGHLKPIESPLADAPGFDIEANLPLSARSRAGYDGGQDTVSSKEGMSMKRLFRRRWLFLTLIPFVLLAGVYVWLLTLPSSGRITKANYDTIQIGMTIDEVTDLMGGDANQRTIRLWPDGHTNQVGAIYMTAESGILPKPQIILDFADDRVTRKQFRQADWNLASLLAAIGLNKPSPMPAGARPPMPAGARPPMPPPASLPSPRPGSPAAPGPGTRP